MNPPHVGAKKATIPQKHQFFRSFQGSPGILEIAVPAGASVDFSGPVTLISNDAYCTKLLAMKPMRFKVNTTSIILEKEHMPKDGAIVGSVTITKTNPTTVALPRDAAIINEFLFLLEWIIVVSILIIIFILRFLISFWGCLCRYFVFARI